MPWDASLDALTQWIDCQISALQRLQTFAEDPEAPIDPDLDVTEDIRDAYLLYDVLRARGWARRPRPKGRYDLSRALDELRDFRDWLHEPASGNVDDEALLTANRISEIAGVALDPLRKRLERYRKKNLDGWVENTDRRPNVPQYLYRYGAIKHVIHPKS